MDKPNILYIMVDHQIYYRHGWDFGPKIRRDNFEEFALSGVNFKSVFF